ncbi:MAG: hypothetical protein ACMX3H_10240 [Sodalis sp. (in: enterobacteria)]|uniref:hypothetical protein n=1 Tax=Sodalis sp. (in: enterobacteria) TaxID=1898979 RepID=UPI0039E25D8F
MRRVNCPPPIEGMTHAAKAMAATALDLLQDSALIASAQEDFARRLAGRPFINPIPDDVNPPLPENAHV